MLLSKDSVLEKVRIDHDVDSLLLEGRLNELLANPDFILDMITVDDDSDFKELLYTLHNTAKESFNA